MSTPSDRAHGPDLEALIGLLRKLDGRGYPSYKQLRGQSFRMQGFALTFEHVQGDPFAAPSRLKLTVPLASTPASDLGVDVPARRVGVEDALLRSFRRALARQSQSRGSGKSGRLDVVALGQEMMPRSGCEIAGRTLVIRLTAGLPARGRRISGRQAADMLQGSLTEAIDRGVLQADRELLRAHADANEDQERLRDLLDDAKLVGFIARGSILPRRSGVDDRPLEREDGAIAWDGPEALERQFELPNGGMVLGTGIPRGVTLICGGGYHGKSTVLRTLARGIYNHIPGDGRELCVTSRSAVSVRAEDGRAVCATDISAFINGLPDGRDTERFYSDNASGSTSQAANIVEAIEVGADCLLIDEDTSATNFMVRDRRMQELIASDREPITPFVDRVDQFRDHLGVSTVLVLGGSGDYFEAADTVVVMDAYRPQLATLRAKEVARAHPAHRLDEDRPPMNRPAPRVPQRDGFSAERGRKRERVKAVRTRAIGFGEEEIDISLIGQVVDDGQARTIGDWLLHCSRGLADGERSISAICDALDARTQESFSASVQSGQGDRVWVRRFEFASALNRLRSVRVVPTVESG